MTISKWILVDPIKRDLDAPFGPLFMGPGGESTNDPADAKCFDSEHAASDAAKKQPDKWVPKPLGDYWPPKQSAGSASYSTPNVFYSDVWPMMSRCLQALDGGKSITTGTLREEIGNGRLKSVLAAAGTYPLPPMPAVDFDRLQHELDSVLQSNAGDEKEHFYVGNNGYCVLIAALNEVVRFGAGFTRPT